MLNEQTLVQSVHTQLTLITGTGSRIDMRTTQLGAVTLVPEMNPSAYVIENANVPPINFQQYNDTTVSYLD